METDTFKGSGMSFGPAKMSHSPGPSQKATAAATTEQMIHLLGRFIAVLQIVARSWQLSLFPALTCLCDTSAMPQGPQGQNLKRIAKVKRDINGSKNQKK